MGGIALDSSIVFLFGVWVGVTSIQIALWVSIEVTDADDYDKLPDKLRTAVDITSFTLAIVIFCLGKLI